MPRESEFYRDNLEQILKFTDGRQLLTIAEVGQFTGLKDYRAIRRRYPFVQKRITAATLARCLCRGETAS